VQNAKLEFLVKTQWANKVDTSSMVHKLMDNNCTGMEGVRNSYSLVVSEVLLGDESTSLLICPLNTETRTKAFRCSS
jgi:hypothetical protein